MSEIFYIDRISQEKSKEKVYGQKYIKLLYGDGLFTKIFSPIFLSLAKWPFLSRLYGYLQKRRSSAKKIKPFLKFFEIDFSDFLEKVEDFRSFNDFFVRKLKPDSRPIEKDEKIATLPADGRYLDYQDISLEDCFFVKGQKFHLEKFLQDEDLFKRYQKGSMVIARLCPVDYHRFHFPCNCTPSTPKLINGYLYSVNPLALKKNAHIFCENKRYLTELYTENFGKVLFVEIGATFVGSIHQTFSPNKFCQKGEEKGFFSFGGSCIAILFESGKIQFEEDLIKASKEKIETRALFGQTLGKATLA